MVVSSASLHGVDMEPSVSELATLTTVEKVCVWIGIDQVLINEVCSIVEIGDGKTEHPRTIAGILMADYTACVVTIQMPVEGAEEGATTPMTLAQRSKVLQIHPICQLSCGVTRPEIRKRRRRRSTETCNWSWPRLAERALG